MVSDPAPYWNELAPEAFAEGDDPMARAMLGRTIIFRLNRIDPQDALVDFEIQAGRVIRVNRAEGLVLEQIGQKAGEIAHLPLVPDAYALVSPGVYTLSGNFHIEAPDFQAAFDIYMPN
ncbi:MAG: hypothetical protein AAGC58_00525 [Asticcacaulis sp.]